jgi:hypothetical protein
MCLEIFLATLFAHLSRHLLNDLEILTPPEIDTRQLLDHATFTKVTSSHQFPVPFRVRQSDSHSAADGSYAVMIKISSSSSLPQTT